MNEFFVIAAVLFAIFLSVIWGLHGAYPDTMDDEEACCSSVVSAFVAILWPGLVILTVVAGPFVAVGYGSYWFFKRKREKKDANQAKV